ncbi:unnamed protein product [Penicillium olsonii]|nr:unnamed protein product [Penicillium olsonii]
MSTMSRMRGIIAERTGGPEVLEHRSDLVIPKPKDGEILVRNTLIGVNYIDIYFRTGAYPSKKPEILGRESVGTIIETSQSQVHGLKKGDRVCYIGPGAYAEYTAVPALHAFKVPDGVSNELAVSAYMQGLAATTTVSEAYQARPGQWALVHAAAGGVGLWLCQLLSRQGVKVIGTASTAEKREIALKHGAEAALDYREDELVKKIEELTHGAGVDVVFDGVGKSTLAIDLAVLGRKGTLVMHGTTSGEPEDFKVGCLTAKNIKFLKPTFMKYLKTREEVDHYAGQVFEALQNKNVSVHVFKQYPFHEVQKAHQVSANWSSHQKGLN